MLPERRRPTRDEERLAGVLPAAARLPRRGERAAAVRLDVLVIEADGGGGHKGYTETSYGGDGLVDPLCPLGGLLGIGIARIVKGGVEHKELDRKRHFSDFPSDLAANTFVDLRFRDHAAEPHGL